MTTHTLNGREVLLVEVPEGATTYSVYHGILEPKFRFKIAGDDFFLALRLPDGTYSLPSPTTVSGMSEEVALTLVESETVWLFNWECTEYLNYVNGQYELATALESLCSFIKSKSLDPDRVVVVIKEK